jgi:hypothetical protein
LVFVIIFGCFEDHGWNGPSLLSKVNLERLDRSHSSVG